MMEAASTSETSVNFYQTARRNNPEVILHTRRRENLKSHCCLLVSLPKILDGILLNLFLKFHTKNTTDESDFDA
jgi:hypothetical protein